MCIILFVSLVCEATQATGLVSIGLAGCGGGSGSFSDIIGQGREMIFCDRMG